MSRKYNKKMEKICFMLSIGIAEKAKTASISLPGWATKNWLPTLFSQHLDDGMTVAVLRPKTVNME